MTLSLATRVGALGGAAGGALGTALEPVVERLLADARHRAEELLADADAAVRDTRDAAATQATRILEQARRDGSDAAARAVGATLVEARRRSRRLVLDARRRAYEEVRRDARTQLAARRAAPEAAALRTRLAAVARARLGPETTVTPDDGCGIVASADGRRIDLGTGVLVERAMRSLGDRLAGLWAP